MAWIPHLMVLLEDDDDPRVLESLIPSLAGDLATGIGRTLAAAEPIRRGGDSSSRPLSIRVTAHGYESTRLAAYRPRAPHQAHLHLVRERGGPVRPGSSAPQRTALCGGGVGPAVLRRRRRPAGGAALRRRGDAGPPGGRGAPVLGLPATRGVPGRAIPPQGRRRVGVVAAGRRDGQGPGPVPRRPGGGGVLGLAIAEMGLVYQSEAFGSTLAQLFDLARLFGVDGAGGRAAPAAGRGRRPLPALLLDGASGTGKRGLAEVFRAATDRRKSPMTVASCNELTNETLLRSILFGHRRGAFTDARDDRPGLVAAAGKGFVLLDDFHRLPDACSSILHSFLEDGEYSRLGEEEVRKSAEAAVVLTVETEPWAERRRAGHLPLAFLARVERLPLVIPPLRDRPEDIEAQARWLARAVSAELGADVELADDAVEHLKAQPFRESNSRELRNVIERAILRHGREVDLLEWSHLQPFLLAMPEATKSVAISTPALPTPPALPTAGALDWQRRLRALAAKMVVKALDVPPEAAEAQVGHLFDAAMPAVWPVAEAARAGTGLSTTPDRPIPLPLWEDLWRCYAVSRLGGPSPAERALGIPANTLRQWINDRESR